MANGCTCFMTDPSTWTRYGDAVEPGSMYEPNPDCPEHGTGITILPAQDAQERPGTREGDTWTGTDVQGPHGQPEAGR